MKGKSEEKLRIGKPNEHKLKTVIERSNTESPSKSDAESKNTKTKTSFYKSDGRSKPSKTKLSDESIAKTFRKVRKVHKTFSCGTQNVDVIGGFKERQETSETKKDSKRRSLPLQSDILQQVPKRKKPISELNLFQAKSKILPEKKAVLSDIFNSFPVNKPPLHHKPQNSPKEPNTPEKSLSFDSLKFLNRSKALCKCYSLENEKIRVPDNPLGVFNVAKKSFIPTSESTNQGNRNPETTSLYASEKPWEKSIGITQEILNVRNRSLASSASGCKIRQFRNKIGSVLTPTELERYQKYLGRESQNEEVGYENTDLESLLTNAKPSNESDFLRRCNDESSQENAEKTLQICQCLHFHTEEGFKKLSLHNNPTTEYGHKFFRVNYYPRDKDEEEEELEGKVELVDKATTTETDIGIGEAPKIRQAKSIPDTNRKKRSDKKVSGNLKVAPKKCTKSVTKVQEKTKKKEPKEESSSQFELLQIQRQVLEQPNRNDSLPAKRRHKEIKVRKPGGMKQRRGVQPLKTSSNITKEEMKQKKALEEMMVLEKLFAKLNSVEHSLSKRKMTSSKKTLEKCPEGNVRHSKKKLEKNPVTGSNGKLLEDKEAEEEYQRRRGRLRSEIIQHVQNWLELDYGSL